MTILNNMKKLFLKSSYILGLVLFIGSYSFAQDAAAEKTAASLYNDGLALLKAKNYAEGLSTLEQALTKAEADGNEKVIDLAKKNGAMAAYNLGNTKRKAKAYDEATAVYTKGSVMNPAYSSNYIGLARVLDDQGKSTDAMTAYMKAADMAKAEGKAKKESEVYKRAKSLVSSSYNAKAYDDVVSLGNSYVSKKDHAEVRYYMAKSLMETGKHTDALPHLEKALTLAPKKKDRIIYAKAQSLEKLGKNQQAVVAYKLITDEKYKKTADYKISTLK